MSIAQMGFPWLDYTQSRSNCLRTTEFADERATLEQVSTPSIRKVDVLHSYRPDTGLDLSLNPVLP